MQRQTMHWSRATCWCKRVSGFSSIAFPATFPPAGNRPLLVAGADHRAPALVATTAWGGSWMLQKLVISAASISASPLEVRLPGSDRGMGEQGEVGEGRPVAVPPQLWVQDVDLTVCNLCHITEGFLASADPVEAAGSGGIEEAPFGGHFGPVGDVTSPTFGPLLEHLDVGQAIGSKPLSPRPTTVPSGTETSLLCAWVSWSCVLTACLGPPAAARAPAVSLGQGWHSEARSLHPGGLATQKSANA